MKNRASRSWMWMCAFLAVPGGVVGAAERSLPSRIEFLESLEIEPGTRFEGTLVGGLSGITWDEDRRLFYAVSDDSGRHSVPRFYVLRIDLGAIAGEPRVDIVDVVELRDFDDRDYPDRTIDPEGITYTGKSLFVASEGQADVGVAPFVREFALDGRVLRELPVPSDYLPQREARSGVRHNSAFESLTLTPDGRELFAATENALKQDGPAAALQEPSPSRILHYSVEAGELLGEYVYWADPVAVQAAPAGGVEVAGLVELLAVDSSTLLALERSFSQGRGNTIRLFSVSLRDATRLDSQSEREVGWVESVAAASKSLLLDLADLGLRLENLEGLTWGPVLPDGRSSLVLIADDNFDPIHQTTQILVFALSSEAVSIPLIQGPDHRSPWSGQWIRGVDGVVTAVAPPHGEAQGEFWLLDEHDAAGSGGSPGIRVVCDDLAPIVPGTRVQVGGRIAEEGRPGDLPRTTIQASLITVFPNRVELPEPVILGSSGKRIPSEVADDDGLRHYDPEFDGVDFWESLEGVRVAIENPLVVGPSNRYGDLVVVADRGRYANARTAIGGLQLRPGDANPERIVLAGGEVSRRLAANVGDWFDGRVVGVIDYDFGRYRLRVTDRLPSLVRRRMERDATRLLGEQGRLTVATYNVLNLAATDGDEKFAGVARTIVEDLGSPDIVALQEIQDNSGSLDDGVVDASRTLERLTEAVIQSGGPRYDFRQIDPADNTSGGAAGANIRNAVLFRVDRLESPSRTLVDPRDRAQIREDRSGPRPLTNPTLLGVQSPSFVGDPSRGFRPSRKPLMVEFLFGEERVYVINNHWISKWEDRGPFGEIQPPQRISEDQRSQQAAEVRDFVERLIRVDPQAAVFVVGDFNEHEFRTPMKVLAGTLLVDALENHPPEDRYTFNYYGDSQSLDHVLLNRGLLDRAAVETDIVHINADFHAAAGASDHDPVVVRVSFADPGRE